MPHQQVMLVVLAVLLATTAACRRRAIREVIERRHCQPKTVLTFVCSGSCSGIVNNRDICHVAHTREAQVALQCYNDILDRWTTHHVTKVVPISCSCRRTDTISHNSRPHRHHSSTHRLLEGLLA